MSECPTRPIELLVGAKNYAVHVYSTLNSIKRNNSDNIRKDVVYHVLRRKLQTYLGIRIQVL